MTVRRLLFVLRMSAIAALGAVGALGSLAWAGDPIGLPARELAAPPSDIESGVVAPPGLVSIESDHALVPFGGAPDRQLGAGTVRWWVPGAGPVTIVPMVPAGWGVRVRDPKGRLLVEGEWTDLPVAAELGLTRRVADLARLLGLPGGSREISAERIDLFAPTSGTYSIESLPPANGLPPGPGSARPPMVLLTDGAEALMAATLLTSRVAVGEVVEVAIRVPGAWPLASLEADVVDESGIARLAAVEARDGGPVVRFVPTTDGRHALSIRAVGTTDPGPWRRSIELLVDAIADPPRLTGRVALESGTNPVDQRILIRASLDRPCEDGVFVAAEVWAMPDSARREDPRGRPICWIAGLSPVTVQPSPSVTLAFDRRWLDRAGVADGAVELRNLRLHDRRTWQEIDRIAAIPLAPLATLAAREELQDRVPTLEELTRGRPGGRATSATLPLDAWLAGSAQAAGGRRDDGANDAAPAGSHALLIVHGYCSDGTTFPPQQFSGPVGLFLDPGQAKGNDAFAQTLLAYGNLFRSYGVVAHSQGGLASLHLYTFYWSGLDWAQPNVGGSDRLIQSVGSPYQGTPLAGNLAVLGQVFGSGCGSISDLTPNGATAWLSTIPTWARERVWYWTTSFLEQPFVYDYCHLITDLFLADPNDGVVEQSRGQLPGANNMGHTQGWCHIEDMRDPPQCTDAARNAQMDGAAAR